jgi:hypothetical protein
VKTPVVVIDKDLGFAFWLTKALDSAGYLAYPAKDVQDAGTLLSEIPLVPGLLILAGGPDEADSFIARVRRWYKDVRIISLVDEEAANEPDFRVDLQLPRPTAKTEQDLAELLVVIDRMMASEPVTL